MEENKDDQQHNDPKVTTLKGMYQDYFLDYASYVILERAVPAILDGLKPVQRRILHAMKQMDDGRYHKVANIIGQTMQYHPHGDASIGAALVNIGQKDLLVDPQGNWGDNRTGDSAAAPRYIEARLTKFALEVAFNKQTTDWQLSYDGRKNEPIQLPMKFPLLLSQGAEGIAVGLSTKVLPHNFIELCKASIKLLEGGKPKLYPDFSNGGMIDVSEYNQGKRGGRVKVRARIEKEDKDTLLIKDLPFGVTTTALIDSIVKANEKGKIKIKKITDNTAAEVEIAIDLAPGISPDVTMDALYAFTSCQVSISPNACVIVDNKPHFLSVLDILKVSTDNTVDLLKQELEIRRNELLEKLHFASLEKIFIENRVYHEIEECETWEAVLETIARELKKYVSTPEDNAKSGDKRIALLRDITEEDIVRLTEIKIKRISKFNTFKADEIMKNLRDELVEVEHHLAHLIQYAIDYFQNLLDKYGKGKERRTKITSFETIHITSVAANNTKLYVNRTEGFIGTSIKKDEFVTECSDIDDIIVFTSAGICKVVKIDSKVFIGKDIIHAAVWKKGDERTTYNMIYRDGGTGKTFVKRFNIKAITRNKDYQLGSAAKGSKVIYFTANPNGESETVEVKLSQSAKARKKIFEFDFSTLDIKGRGSKGNTLTKYPVRKVVQSSKGKSTLGKIDIYLDKVSGKLNKEKRGYLVGAFDTGDKILIMYKNGSYEVADFDMNRHFEPSKIQDITQFNPEMVISAMYYDGNKGWTMVKRFKIETNKPNQVYSFVTEHPKSSLLFVSTKENPKVEYMMKVNSQKIRGEVNLSEFIDLKGWKALGNKLSDQKLTHVKEIEETQVEKLKPGDSVDFDLDENGQGRLF